MTEKKITAIQHSDDKYEDFVNEVSKKTWYEYTLIQDEEN